LLAQHDFKVTDIASPLQDVVVRKGTVSHGEDGRNSRCGVRASQRPAGNKRCGRVLSRATRIPRGAAWDRCVQREL
jgi:hypothetical protein